MTEEVVASWNTHFYSLLWLQERHLLISYDLPHFPSFAKTQVNGSGRMLVQYSTLRYVEYMDVGLDPGNRFFRIFMRIVTTVTLRLHQVQ